MDAIGNALLAASGEGAPTAGASTLAPAQDTYALARQQFAAGNAARGYGLQLSGALGDAGRALAAPVYSAVSGGGDLARAVGEFAGGLFGYAPPPAVPVQAAAQPGVAPAAAGIAAPYGIQYDRATGPTPEQAQAIIAAGDARRANLPPVPKGYVTLDSLPVARPAGASAHPLVTFDDAAYAANPSAYAPPVAAPAAVPARGGPAPVVIRNGSGGGPLVIGGVSTPAAPAPNAVDATAAGLGMTPDMIARLPRGGSQRLAAEQAFVGLKAAAQNEQLKAALIDNFNKQTQAAMQPAVGETPAQAAARAARASADAATRGLLLYNPQAAQTGFYLGLPGFTRE